MIFECQSKNDNQVSFQLLLVKKLIKKQTNEQTTFVASTVLASIILARVRSFVSSANMHPSLLFIEEIVGPIVLENVWATSG